MHRRSCRNNVVSCVNSLLAYCVVVHLFNKSGNFCTRNLSFVIQCRRGCIRQTAGHRALPVPAPINLATVCASIYHTIHNLTHTPTLTQSLTLNLTLNLTLTWSYLMNKHRYSQHDVSGYWITSRLHDHNQQLSVTISVCIGYIAVLYQDAIDVQDV